MKAQVMKRAWEITYKAINEFGGNSRMYFKKALAQAWAEMKNRNGLSDEEIARLEGLGFQRWQKGEMDRLYINASELGLKYEYHRTARTISDAWFCGENVSNNDAYAIKDAKTYINVKTGLISSTWAQNGRAAQKLTGLPLDEKTTELVVKRYTVYNRKTYERKWA